MPVSHYKAAICMEESQWLTRSLRSSVEDFARGVSPPLSYRCCRRVTGRHPVQKTNYNMVLKSDITKPIVRLRSKNKIINLFAFYLIYFSNFMASNNSYSEQPFKNFYETILSRCILLKKLPLTVFIYH